MRRAIQIVTIISVLAATFGSGLYYSKTFSRNYVRRIASDNAKPFFYRIVGKDIFGNGRTLWPPYTPLDYLEHPTVGCNQLSGQKSQLVVQRLNIEGAYVSCGTCESFRCGTEDGQQSLKHQEHTIKQLMGEYLEASAKHELDFLLGQGCQAHSFWPCNVSTSIEQVVDSIRRFNISHEINATLGSKVDSGSDPASIKKHIYLALNLLDEDYRATTLAQLKGIAVQDKTLDFDSMYTSYVISPGKIALKDSVAINDSYMRSRNLENVYGIRAFVAILHEYGHFIDDLLEKNIFKAFKSNESDWKTASERDDTISFYSLYSWKENFAESFAAYLLDPLFQCYAPNRYEFLLKIVKINKEIYGATKPFAQIDCGNNFIKEALARRAETLKKHYGDSLLAMEDELPLLIEGKPQKKRPGSLCRKDDYCENDGLGCQSNYKNFFHAHVGRCRALPHTQKATESCDKDDECLSNRCNGSSCR